VAALLANGLRNRDIAQALVIGEGAADVLVEHILRKLGFKSRSQVAAWAARRGWAYAHTQSTQKGRRADRMRSHD
jgi:DNA-binding NarL/FixJ family response regulator